MIVVAVLGLGCGSVESSSTPQADWKCKAIGSSYLAFGTLLESDGTCSEAPESTSGKVSFSQGQFVSPVGDLLKCRTTQDDCAVSVTCSVAVLNAHMSFDA